MPCVTLLGCFIWVDHTKMQQSLAMFFSLKPNQEVLKIAQVYFEASIKCLLLFDIVHVLRKFNCFSDGNFYEGSFSVSV